MCVIPNAIIDHPKFQDENRDPQHRGYSRVADGSLSNSSTSTSLDTVLIENNNELVTIPRHTQHQSSFGPISETEESQPNATKDGSRKTSSLKVIGGESKASKTSLKSSKVSFEQRDPDYSSDEDSFEDRRHHFQQRKATSVDHKGILKVSVRILFRFFFCFFIFTNRSFYKKISHI